MHLFVASLVGPGLYLSRSCPICDSSGVHERRKALSSPQLLYVSFPVYPLKSQTRTCQRLVFQSASQKESTVPLVGIEAYVGCLPKRDPSISMAKKVIDVATTPHFDETERDNEAAEILNSPQSRRVVRKIDFWLIPLLFVTYNLNFMVRTFDVRPLFPSSNISPGQNYSVVGISLWPQRLYRRCRRATDAYILCSDIPFSIASPRLAVQLGFLNLLLRIPLLGIPNFDTHPASADRKIRGREHILLGRSGRSHSCLHQLRGPHHRALSSGRGRSDYIPSISVHYGFLVYSR